VEQANRDEVDRRAAGRQRGAGRQQLAGVGLNLVQVHVLGGVQPIADLGGGAEGRAGRQVRHLGRGQRVAGGVRGRRDQAQVEVIVAEAGVIVAVGDVGIVV